MTSVEMTPQRLAEIVEAYGASADRWPVAERQAAEALASRDPHARTMIEEARQLDALLDVSPESNASEALTARIMAARPRSLPAIAGKAESGRIGSGGLWRTLVQLVWPYSSPAVPAGALAASIMLGISLGFISPVAVNALGLSTATVAANVTTNAASEQLVAFALAENEYPEDWKR